jgi:hypothetical protein
MTTSKWEKLMTKIILTFLFFGLSTPLMAEISKAECGSYDFSDRYPPVRDQDGHGYCWAFAGVALYEEQLCLESKKNPKLNYKCGDKLSVLDFSRCDFSLGSKKGEGGNSNLGLECILSKNDIVEKQGVCLEEFASYNKFREGWSKKWSDFTGGNYPSTMHNKFVDYKNSCTQDTNSNEIENVVSEYTEILSHLLPEHESMGVDFKKALTNKSVDEQFLKEILITPECKRRRIETSSKLKVISKSMRKRTLQTATETEITRKVIPEKSVDEKLKLLKESFIDSRSVVANMCWTKYSSDPAATVIEKFFNFVSSIGSDDDCGAHAVVYNGMRWNSDKNRCEISVRNSWGEGSAFHGWEDAERALKYTNDFVSLKEIE